MLLRTGKAAGLSFPVRPAVGAAVAATGAGAAAVSMVAAPGPAGALGAGLALIMLLIAAVDGHRFIIPDIMSATALVLGLIYAVFAGEGEASAAVLAAALRAACLALSFLALRLSYARWRGRQGLGLGDVKLAAVAGAWLDWSIMPLSIEIAALSALSAYGVRCLVRGRRLRSGGRLPFGLFFAPAIWIAWLLQTTVLRGW